MQLWKELCLVSDGSDSWVAGGGLRSQQILWEASPDSSQGGSHRLLKWQGELSPMVMLGSHHIC